MCQPVNIYILQIISYRGELTYGYASVQMLLCRMGRRKAAEYDRIYKYFAVQKNLSKLFYSFIILHANQRAL